MSNTVNDDDVHPDTQRLNYLDRRAVGAAQSGAKELRINFGVEALGALPVRDQIDQLMESDLYLREPLPVRDRVILTYRNQLTAIVADMDRQLGRLGAAQVDQAMTVEAEFQKAVDALPPPEREAFELKRAEGLTYKQVAERLGITDEEAVTRLRRAYKALRPAQLIAPPPSKGLIGTLAAASVLSLIAAGVSWDLFSAGYGLAEMLFSFKQIFWIVMLILGGLCAFGAIRLWSDASEYDVN